MHREGGAEADLHSQFLGNMDSQGLYAGTHNHLWRAGKEEGADYQGGPSLDLHNGSLSF